MACKLPGRQGLLPMAIALIAIMFLFGLAAGCGSGAMITPDPPRDGGSDETSNDLNADSGSVSDPPAPDQPAMPGSDHGPPADLIGELLAGMSTAEKIGQLMFVGIDGTDLQPGDLQFIRDYRPGGIVFFRRNIDDLRQGLELVNTIDEAGVGGIPLFYGIDQEGGPVSRVPDEFSPMPPSAAVGRRGDTELAYRFGQLLAEQVRALNLNVNFAPVLDVNAEPVNPAIGARAFGSAPRLVGDMGRAALEGMVAAGVIPVVKHFPGHGATEVDSHGALPTVADDKEELFSSHLLPFQEAFRAGAPALMMAHIVYPAIDPEYPASMSPAVIGGLLRDEMGFDGLVITDDLTMGAVTEHRRPAEAAVAAVKAGADMVMIAHDDGGGTLKAATADALRDAFDDGIIPGERLDEAVRRILQLKIKSGLYCPGGAEKEGECPRPGPPMDLDHLNGAVEGFTREISRP